MFTFTYLLQSINLPGGTLQGPVSSAPVSSLGQLVTRLIPYVFSIAGFIAFIYLIVGGYKYLSSSGDEKALMGAKHTITSALVGLIIVFLAYWLVIVVEYVIGVPDKTFTLVPEVYAQSTSDIRNNFSKGALINKSLGQVLTDFLPVILGTAMIGFFLFFLYGAFSMMTSAGDEKTKASAKNKITSAFIGLLIVLLAYWIIQIIEKVVGGSSNFRFF